MSLKLMYITNNTNIASIAQNAGVDRIFVDLEYIGKSLRQGGMDTVQNRHTVEDAKRIRSVLDRSELLVRVNPIHEATSEYTSSKEEIEAVVAAGADIIMLPYFKTPAEVKQFLQYVDHRAKTMLLFETAEAIEHIDEILDLPGIDEVFIGLNDLSLSYGRTFMFELLADGTVDRIVEKFKVKHYTFGFGGIASLGKGLLPAEFIIREHYRLGSTAVILSRSFCNVQLVQDLAEVKSIMDKGLNDIRTFEKTCEDFHDHVQNRTEIRNRVNTIVKTIKDRR